MQGTGQIQGDLSSFMANKNLILFHLFAGSASHSRARKLVGDKAAD